ncbi:uncharacterized protein BX663DRAFT_231532 [Cokeromyces recurvatus]|uniref:uncharacterized protein n=1 Tax=Cokeromyces recurvatus TaxID=90255 RepID=UPI00221F17A1|nr:uncharacterized protein BX663DRAFT_231532 [Cokeromyces recurvatus]KAI7898830.1 hypothetical protein BX663DRAFT_231532 [Cokeromyces recurvatus]
MEYALMLTLCELSLAHIPIPVECQNIEENTRKKQNKIRYCVQKLSTLPQTWTSYSGYFRDVVVICFAIRYPMEKEILERLHTNITLNQAKNFDLLQKQQDYLMHWREEELSTLHHLKHSQHELLVQMDAVRDTHLKTVNQIQSIFDALVLLQNQTEVMMQRYNQMVEYHIQEVTTQFNQLSLRQEVEVDHFLSSIMNGLRKLDEQLVRMTATQQDVFEHWEEAKSIQGKYMDIWQETVEQINTSLNQILDQTLNHAKDLQEDLSIIQDKILFVTFPFKWLTEFSTDLISVIERFVLDVLIYTMLFNYVYHNSLFNNRAYHPLMTKFGVSLVSVLSQFYLLQYFKGLNPDIFNTIYFRLIIIILEWILKNYSRQVWRKLDRQHFSLLTSKNKRSIINHDKTGLVDEAVTAVVPHIKPSRFLNGNNSSEKMMINRKKQSIVYYFQRYHYNPHNEHNKAETFSNQEEEEEEEEEEDIIINNHGVPENKPDKVTYKKDYPSYHFHRYYDK